MILQANLYDAKEKTGPPGGTYNVQISKPPVFNSSTKGSERIEFEVQITDHVGDEHFSRLRHWIYKSEDDGWGTVFMRRMCDAFGVKYSKESFDTDHFHLKTAKGVLEDTVYEGKPQKRWAKFISG